MEQPKEAGAKAKVKVVEEEDEEEEFEAGFANCFKCGGKGWLVLRQDEKKQRKRACVRCEKRRKKLEEAMVVENALKKKRSKLTVGIVGGGIGGAAAALAVSKLGFQVKLFEKDKNFQSRKQGYGLTLQQGFNALRDLGLLGDLPQDTPSFSHYAFGSKGKILGYFGSSFSEYFELGQEYSKKTSGKFNGKGKYNVHIPRQHLRFMLLDAIEKQRENVQIIWGKRFHSFGSSEEEKIRAIFKNDGGRNEAEMEVENVVKIDQEEHEFDLLVAADGIYSTIRKEILGDELQYLSCVVVLGISPIHHDLTHQRVIETMDGETRIYAMPFTSSQGEGIQTDPTLKGKDSIMWQLSFPIESLEDARKICQSSKTLKAEALRRCGKWHAPIPEMIQITDPELLSGHPVFDRPELDPSLLDKSINAKGFGGKLAFVGDAAHPMSPFKGQGANQGLLDAVLLAKTISSETFLQNPEPVIQAYHKKMCERSKAKVVASRTAADVLHKPKSTGIRQDLDILEQNGISANSPKNLNERIVTLVGYGHKPHLLHEEKVKLSRSSK